MYSIGEEQSLKDLLPTLRGLNAWTIKQKIKDHTVQRASTIQLLHSFDVYHFPTDKRGELPYIIGTENTKNFISEYGVLRRKTGEMVSHSFVLQFLKLFEALSAKGWGIVSDAVSIQDTSNDAQSVYAYNTTVPQTQLPSMWFNLEAPSANSNYGIQIGTGVNAPATTDYALQTLIAHGVGAGQLQWNACGVGGAAIAGANVDMCIIRTFTNGSGLSITAREIGLTTSNCSGYITQKYFLLAHDAVNQAIADGETAAVAYTLRTTV